MTTINTNIDDYSRLELLELVDLPENTSDEIISKTFVAIIKKYISNKNEKLALFFHNARAKLLNEDFGDNDDTNQPESEANNWLDNQYRTEDNISQNDKITQRDNKINIFQPKRTTNPVMSRQQLGVNNTIPLKVAQDGLNPTLRQTITRYISIDSQYKPLDIPYTFNPTGPRSSSNFTVNLTESLKNVLSLTIQSVSIPNSTYVFDTWTRNTCFWVLTANTSEALEISGNNLEDISSCSKICITPGTYANAIDLVSEINYDISNCGSSDISNNGLTAQLNNTNIHAPIIQFFNFTNKYIKLLFYREHLENNIWNSIADCSGCNIRPDECLGQMSYQQNLGYYLGFRITNRNINELSVIIPKPSDNIINANHSLINHINNDVIPALDISYSMIYYTTLVKNINIILGNAAGVPFNFNYMLTHSGADISGVALATVPINLHGSQHFYVGIDDYNNNRGPENLISISPPSTKLPLPGYISKQSRSRSNNPNISQVQDLNAGIICDTSANDFNIGNTLFVPYTGFNNKNGASDSLTQNQLYAANQILANQSTNNLEHTDSSLPDILAIVTNSSSGANVSYDLAVLPFERTYFGPVTIERLGIKLYNDIGNLVNLNGRNWSFIIRVEQLYQY